LWSYRDFPLKLAELGLVHRHEKSGVLAGLLRVRSFHQDDAHIFCSTEEMEDEIVAIVQLILDMYRVFGFYDARMEVSTRPEKSIGSDEGWALAESALESALKRLDLPYDINPGEGAFYGPKIDFHIRDALKRTWQCGTVQVDFSMPMRFELEYTGSDGAKHTHVMIHRAIFGSLERFIAVLLENTGWALPLWLAPVQVKVLPISEKHLDYGRQVVENLLSRGARAELDERSEKIGQKIRQATAEKVPYMLIVGGKEADSGTVSVRKRTEGDLGQRTVEGFLELFQEDVESRR
ncbi:MAG: threonine--tRNA ligase, partial [Candidatus Abyssubacteria bacterium]|nr:threonine--tRNA ligase [Candidatus Abyssubacteria bacterium]